MSAAAAAYTLDFQPPKPFRDYYRTSLKTIPMYGGRHGTADEKKRVKKFIRKKGK
jgi:hypothetical protein